MKPRRHVDVYGVVRYYTHGIVYREDGPSTIQPDGTEIWGFLGIMHRENAPAVIGPNGSVAWYKNNKLHRLDGPAVMREDGRKFWYIEGYNYSEEQFLIATKAYNEN